MFDVVPPSPGDNPSQHRGRRSRRFVSAQPKNSAASARSPVVEVAWKLPARLRRPIRDQLRKERLQKQQREAIVRFERRPLITQHVLTQPNTSPDNVGAEHHTGDVYRNQRPGARVALPPYVGSAARMSAGPGLVRRKAKRVPQGKMTTRQKQVQSPPARSRDVPPRGPKDGVRQVADIAKERSDALTFRPAPLASSTRKPAMFLERDAPYLWSDKHVAANVPVRADDSEDILAKADRGSVRVKPPRHRFSLPFTLSVWPFGGDSGTTKKKFQIKGSRGVGTPLFLFALGCAVIAASVWNMQNLGRAISVLPSVSQRAQEGLRYVAAAQAALAESDLRAGGESLGQAHEKFSEARGELAEALSLSREILKIMDVSGRVVSGDELLAAGEELTTAGQHLAAGLAGFLQVQIFPDEEGARRSVSLLEAVSTGQKAFGHAGAALTRADAALQRVKVGVLPEEIRGQVRMLQERVPQLGQFLHDFEAQSDTFAHLLGVSHARQYLLVFANNHELRPVGGFLGTIGLVNIDSGRVEQIDIRSVYDGDGQLKEFIAPPDPLLSVTNRWYLRDANWFVDFRESGRKIAQFYEKEGGPTVDGVVLMTPEVIRRFLRVTGPMAVPGYDVVVTADNFYEVTQAEVTYSYDKELNKPKQFLADLTPLLLNKLFAGGGAAPVLALAEAAAAKDLLLYFADAQAQASATAAGWAGALPDGAAGFLAVNNANIGGHKSDQFIDQEIDYRVDVLADGSEATVTIRRTHRGPEERGVIVYPEGEDPTRKDNVIYQRVLVPQGAELLEAKGFAAAQDVPRLVLPDKDILVQADRDVVAWQAGQDTDDSGTRIGTESGYTFFANWVITKPGQTTVTLYRYRLPGGADLPTLVKPGARTSLFVHKQPGQMRTKLRASLKLPEKMRIVHTVPQSGITREAENEVIYRGDFNSDITIGAVFESI